MGWDNSVVARSPKENNFYHTMLHNSFAVEDKFCDSTFPSFRSPDLSSFHKAKFTHQQKNPNCLIPLLSSVLVLFFIII